MTWGEFDQNKNGPGYSTSYLTISRYSIVAFANASRHHCWPTCCIRYYVDLRYQPSDYHGPLQEQWRSPNFGHHQSTTFKFHLFGKEHDSVPKVLVPKCMQFECLHSDAYVFSSDRTTSNMLFGSAPFGRGGIARGTTRELRRRGHVTGDGTIGRHPL